MIVIKKAIIRLIVFAVLVIILTIILDFIDITQYFPFSHNYDWISFGGSFLGGIIGGLATFGGVYFSLKSQKEADDEKNRQAVIPVMEYKISYDEDDFYNSSGQLISHINVEGAICEDESEKWYFNLIVENIGLGSAQITEITFDFKENEAQHIVYSTKIEYCYKLIKTNSSKDFRFLIYVPKKNFYKDNKPIRDFTYLIEICVCYEDLIGNRYQQKNSCFYY